MYGQFGLRKKCIARAQICPQPSFSAEKSSVNAYQHWLFEFLLVVRSEVTKDKKAEKQIKLSTVSILVFFFFFFVFNFH